MPTTGIRDEDRLIDLFLSVYEGQTWTVELTNRQFPERVRDRGVEIIATQIATGRTLAIEHTIIEPFVGEKRDFYQHFQEFQRRLTADASLGELGFALYVNAPVNVLPHGTNWTLIIDDVCAWVRSEKATFGEDAAIRHCPSCHHPNGTIPLQVRRQPLQGAQEAFVIVQRYGDLRVDESVRKALANKLPKLVATDVGRRILMLERDQGFVYPTAIVDAVEGLRAVFPDLEKVHEVWIADTASFDQTKEYVEFLRVSKGIHAESYTFYRGKLVSMGRDGMPVPI